MTPALEPLEDRIALTSFTMTSPTAPGPLPAGVTPVGGIVLDLVGVNGTRVVSQIAATSLFHGFFDTGSPVTFRGNPGTIGAQEGFSPAILQALGGGLSEVAIRVTLLDGDTAAGDFDFGENQLLLNSVPVGDFSAVVTQETDPAGQTALAPLTNGFPNVRLATGFFHTADPQALSDIFTELAQSGQMVIQLRDVDPFDNHFDFTVGLDGGLLEVGRPPQIDQPPDVPTQPLRAERPDRPQVDPQIALLFSPPTITAPSPPVTGPGASPLATPVPTGPPGGPLAPLLTLSASLTSIAASEPQEHLTDSKQFIRRSPGVFPGQAVARARDWLLQAMADVGDAMAQASELLRGAVIQGARDLLALANRPVPIAPAEPRVGFPTQASDPHPTQDAPPRRGTANQIVILAVVALAVFHAQGRNRPAFGRSRARRQLDQAKHASGTSASAEQPSSTS